MEDNVLRLPSDIYRVDKETLLSILNQFHIKYREQDTVAEIRPVVAGIKAYFRNGVTEEKKYIYRRLVEERRYVTEVELLKYPSLQVIQEFLQDRENLYDNPEAGGIDTSYYEEILRKPVTISEEEEIQIRRESDKEPKKMSKEKLPLISAGTYHGLPSENPNDFIDKYEIAAISNHWQELTKIKLFPAHLTGTALTWYRYYSSGRDVNDWEDLKKTFVTTFTPVAQAQTLQAILERKIQGKDQPVLNYYLEVLELCRRHDPTTTDRQIIHHVIQGLKPEFCEKILNETCETLQQLEDSLRRIELQIEMGRLNKEKYRRVENGEVGLAYSDNHRTELNSLQAEIKALTQTVANLQLQNNTYSSEQRGREQNMPRRYYGSTNQHRPIRYTATDTRREYQPTQNNADYTRQYTQPWNTFMRGSPSRGRPSPRGNYRQDTGDRRIMMYCTYCRRNNHNTENCRTRGRQPNEMQRARNKYCSHCRMTNHSTEDCFKLNRNSNQTKNA